MLEERCEERRVTLVKISCLSCVRKLIEDRIDFLPIEFDRHLPDIGSPCRGFDGEACLYRFTQIIGCPLAAVYGENNSLRRGLPGCHLRR